MNQKTAIAAGLLVVSTLLAPGAQSQGRHSPTDLAPQVITDAARPGAQEIDYHLPPQADGRVPLVVVLHGGGDKGSSEVDRIAAKIARGGSAVAVPTYYSGQPRSQEDVLETFENVVCSIRYARTRAADLGADPDNLTLVGFSYGGFPALAIALSPEGAYNFPCLPDVSHLPQRVIGLGGAYSYDTQVSTLGWLNGFTEFTAAGHIGTNLELPVILMHGLHDTNSPIDSAMDLYDRLSGAGHTVAFEVLDTRHAELIEPRDVAGSQVVAAIIAATRGRVSTGQFGPAPVSVYSRLIETRP